MTEFGINILAGGDGYKYVARRLSLVARWKSKRAQVHKSIRREAGPAGVCFNIDGFG
jgi:hypothetical protein